MKTDYRSPGYAARYRQSRRLSPAAQRRWAQELQQCAQGSSVEVVVDVGAGSGRFWPVFVEAWHPRAIVAVDSSLPMLWAGDIVPEVRRVVADLHALPVRRGSVDVFFCSMVLHYSSNPAHTLGQLSRQLAEGGVLIIRTGTPETLRSYEFLRFFPTALQAENEVMPEFGAVLGWVESAGFVEITCRSVEIPSEGSRRQRFQRVVGRGFPSLQLVGRREFVVGAVRYAVFLMVDALRHRRPVGEQAVLVSGRRRSPAVRIAARQ